MTIAATLAGLAFYCFVQGITPGPANLCSLATTLRYGRTLALRQWYGLIAGFYAVSFASVLVVWTVGQVASGLMGWLTVAGAVYVLWLAWTMVAPSREGHALYEAKPTAASGFPWNAASMAVKGDPIADLTEDLAAEQKARVTYDNILRLSDDPDVNDVIKFLRQREIVHFQRFGEALQKLRERLDQKNVYYMNPALDL